MSVDEIVERAWDDGCSRDPHWLARRAVRLALEEAAKIADEDVDCWRGGGDEFDAGRSCEAKSIATRIRAMKGADDER